MSVNAIEGIALFLLKCMFAQFLSAFSITNCSSFSCSSLCGLPPGQECCGCVALWPVGVCRVVWLPSGHHVFVFSERGALNSSYLVLLNTQPSCGLAHWDIKTSRLSAVNFWNKIYIMCIRTDFCVFSPQYCIPNVTWFHRFTRDGVGCEVWCVKGHPWVNCCASPTVWKPRQHGFVQKLLTIQTFRCVKYQQTLHWLP